MLMWSSRTTICVTGPLSAISFQDVMLMFARLSDPSAQPNSGAVIGSGGSVATTDQFQAFWQELASRFSGNENVM